MKIGDLVQIKQSQINPTKTLWDGDIALIVRKVPFYEMQGKVSDPYQDWFEVLLCNDGQLKTIREDYLERRLHGNR